MKWFRKAKDPEVIHHVYDLVPKPPFDWDTATSKEATEYFKSLSRIQLIEIEDRNIVPEHLWEKYFDVLNSHEIWPTDHDIYEVCNRVAWKSDNLFKQFDELQRKVAGMQKKLDRLASLIENTEVTMSGKTALKL